MTDATVPELPEQPPIDVLAPELVVSAGPIPNLSASGHVRLQLDRLHDPADVERVASVLAALDIATADVAEVRFYPGGVTVIQTNLIPELQRGIGWQLP